MLYSRLTRGLLFRFGSGDPETAHERTVTALAKLGAATPVRAAMRRWFAVDAPCTVFGVRFPNRVGLAAGMDKNGVALRGWPALGFGHVEVGTVTQHTQQGNPKPRLYRLPASEALINRMGFNNAGAQALADRLHTLGPVDIPLGMSIGKSKSTPLEDAVDDYRTSLRTLYPYGAYFVINISSPNTPGLRELQDRTLLDELVTELRAEARDKPLLVKIAPDLTEPAIAEVLEVCLDRGIAGVIATNTTLARDGLDPAETILGEQSGGLSGRPLARRALEVVSFIHREAGGALPIIGVGGIHIPEDGIRLLDAGASLIQLFTGLVYAGPSLVRGIGRLAARRGH